MCSSWLFQFTPLREGRRSFSPFYTAPEQISIHAPARGATCTTHYSTAMSIYFNSRPCERGDQRPGRRLGRHRYFNSRPCERGDASARWISRHTAYFNSRPCERGDFYSDTNILAFHLFQFTPLREGRPAKSPVSGSEPISIHAPARGATTSGAKWVRFSDGFQFTPLREGRRCQRKRTTMRKSISIHAPARGATRAKL